MAQRMNLKKVFFKLMNNSVVGNTIENMYKFHENEVDNTTKYNHESFFQTLLNKRTIY